MDLDSTAYDLIDQYIAGALDKEALKDFRQRLQNDPNFAAEVNLYQHIDTTLANKKESDFITTLNKVRKQTEATQGQASIVSLNTKKRNWLYYAAAASIALLVGTYFLLSAPTSHEDLFLQYAEPSAIALTHLGDETDSNLQKIEKLFNQKDFAAVLPYLDQYIDNKPNNYQVLLYKGQALLFDHQLDEANQTFDAILNSNALDTIKDETRWYQALLYLKQNKIKEATALLKTLEANAHPKWAKAAAALIVKL